MMLSFFRGVLLDLRYFFKGILTMVSYRYCNPVKSKILKPLIS